MSRKPSRNSAAQQRTPSAPRKRQVKYRGGDALLRSSLCLLSFADKIFCRGSFTDDSTIAYYAARIYACCNRCIQSRGFCGAAIITGRSVRKLDTDDPICKLIAFNDTCFKLNLIVASMKLDSISKNRGFLYMFFV